MSIFEQVQILLEGAATATAWAPPVSTGIEAQAVEMCVIKEAHGEALQKYYSVQGHWFCKFVRCRHAPVPAEDRTSGDWSNWAGWLGGGGGITPYLRENNVGSWGIEEYTGKKPEEYMNVKDSLVWSVLSFCIPGIVYNLDKYRQILCMYAHCLETNAEHGETLMSECEDMRSYQECKYLFGGSLRFP